MKYDRKPVYSKNNMRRVVSVANGLWQLQEHGTMPSTREQDAWFNRGPATDFDVALMHMGGQQ